jgi:signal transduction histidine kinase
MQKIDSVQIVDYAISALKFQAEQKKIQIIVSLNKPLAKVNADLEKTTWVMVNLLNNAIRYSPDNSEIHVTLKSENDNVLFSITDTGKGIDPLYLDKIFDKYFRVPGSDKIGTGLGLAISKEFIEAQNGQIGVISIIGKGSTFYFKLPIASSM